MSSTYSQNLAIELIGTGDQAGAWGNTTNTNLGTLIEQAISGYVTQAVSTGTTTTITIPNGATGVARNMYIELTGTGGANTFLEVPANKKLYFIYNNSSGAVTVRVAGQTGVAVAVGEKKILASNGTDVVEATTYIISGGSGNLTTLTATSANITTLTGTTFGDTGTTNIRGVSGNITTLIGSVFGTTASTQLRGASANITIATLGAAAVTTLSVTSGSVTNLTVTSATVTNLGATSASITTLGATSASITTLSLTSGNITTLSATSGNITNLSSTSAVVTTLTGTTATYNSSTVTNLNVTSATITDAIIGDLIVDSATITTSGTNQNFSINPNGTGQVLIGGAADTGFASNGVTLEVIADQSGVIYPLLSQSKNQARACLLAWNTVTSGDNIFITFITEETPTGRGTITYNRGAGQVAYNTTSDRRAKIIEGPVTNSGQVVDALNVYTGRMIWADINMPMMIADEAMQVTPYCVTGEPNAVDEKGNPIYQQMDYSALVPLLLAEIQSLRSRVAALESSNP